MSDSADLVREIFDAGFNRADPGPALAGVADDVVDHSPIPGGPGPAGFAARMAALRAAFVDEARFGVFLSDGDLVAFTWEFVGVHRGTFAGVEPTGKVVTLPGINVERLRDGKIVEHWSQFDLAGLVRTLNS